MNPPKVFCANVDGLPGAELAAGGCPNGLELVDGPNENGAEAGAVVDVGVWTLKPKPPAAGDGVGSSLLPKLNEVLICGGAAAPLPKGNGFDSATGSFGAKGLDDDAAEEDPKPKAGPDDEEVVLPNNDDPELGPELKEKLLGFELPLVWRVGLSSILTS